MGYLFWILSLSPIIYLLWKYFNKNYDYFADRGIPFEKPFPLLGNMLPLFVHGRSFPEFLIRLANKYRPHRFYGIFDMRDPMYIIEDPDLAKQISIKEFDHFANHIPFAASSGDDLVINSLFSLKDQKWKDMRSTLSPAFTSSKMKMMYELIQKCAESLVKYCQEHVNNKNELEVNIRDLFSRTTIDVISTCAFGLEVDSLNNPKNDVYLNVRKAFDFQDIWVSVKVSFITLIPSVAKLLNISITPKECNKFFKDIVSDTIKHRRSTNTFRPDVIQLLMQAVDGNLNHKTEDSLQKQEGFAVVEESVTTTKVGNKIEWTDVDLAAQCFVFFLAGFDTTATTLTFASYELAVAPEIQEHLYEEIKETKIRLNGQSVTYEMIHKMEYLDAFISEVLRHHPPGFILDRVCNKDTKVQDHTGRDYVIPNNAKLWINAYGIHHSHKYWPNPMKFDPERFMGDNKKNILPNTYMPFGLGPRACIGSRFALMEVKMLLYYILSEFSFEVCDKTMVPLRYGSGFALNTDGDMILMLKKRL